MIIKPITLNFCYIIHSNTSKSVAHSKAYFSHSAIAQKA